MTEQDILQGVLVLFDFLVTFEDIFGLIIFGEDLFFCKILVPRSPKESDMRLEATGELLYFNLRFVSLVCLQRDAEPA